MNRTSPAIYSIIGVTAFLLLASIGIIVMPPATVTANSEESDAQRRTETARESHPGIVEARERSRLLQETIHASLHYIHEQYYREDEGIAIPALTLKSVFRELALRRNVEVRWLAVNAQAMNVEHKAQNELEKRAVAALASGKDEYEEIEGGVYRHFGAITLSSECLKCHLPSRTSTADRRAGLMISMPLKKQD